MSARLHCNQIRFCLKKISKRCVFYHLGLQISGGTSYSVLCVVAVFDVQSSMEKSMFFVVVVVVVVSSVFFRCFHGWSLVRSQFA